MKAIYLEWVDHATTCGWQHVEDAGSVSLKTVGWLIKEDATSVYVSTSHDQQKTEEFKSVDILCILKSTIKKRKYIKVT